MKIADLIEVVPTVEIIELWERKYESDCDMFQGLFSRATVSFEQSELNVAEVRIKSSDRICVYFEKENKDDNE